MLALTTALLLSVAHAAPVTLDWSGRLVTSSGDPVSGTHEVMVRLHSVQVDGTPFFEKTVVPTNISDGYVNIPLDVSDTGTLLDSTHFTADVWVDVAVDDVPMGPRTLLHSVPRAAVADIATTASDAEALDGWTFGSSNDSTTDIRAYLDRRLCESHTGTWSDTTGCDPGITLGSATASGVSCPANYTVCTVPEANLRVAATPVTDANLAGHHYLAQERGQTGDLYNGSPSPGNRWSFLACNFADGNAGQAVLGHVTNNGAVQWLDTVICWTKWSNQYPPLCCR